MTPTIPMEMERYRIHDANPLKPATPASISSAKGVMPYSTRAANRKRFAALLRSIDTLEAGPISLNRNAAIAKTKMSLCMSLLMKEGFQMRSTARTETTQSKMRQR